MGKVAKRTLPTTYKRSTPVIRLRRNALKIERYAGIVKARLSSWGPVTDSDVASARIYSDEIFVQVAGLKDALDRLEKKGFAPPKRNGPVVFVPGQSVEISKKHRPKYVTVYEEILKVDKHLLDDLQIEKILPSGEIVVRRGDYIPFVVPKSHLSARKPS